MTKNDTTNPTAAAEDKKRKPRVPKGSKPAHRPRGPPRPHKKLAQEILDNRISKLQKRIDRSRAQLADAERHIDGYSQEAKYRSLDAAAPTPPTP